MKAAWLESKSQQHRRYADRASDSLIGTFDDAKATSLHNQAQELLGKDSPLAPEDIDQIVEVIVNQQLGTSQNPA